MKQQQLLNRERNRLLVSFEKLLEGPMIFLGFFWLILLVLELVGQLTPLLQTLSMVVWAIFIIDFMVKIILAPARIKFLKKNWLTVISLLIPALRIFRILRVVRLVQGFSGIRLIRIIASLNRSMRSLTATLSRRGFTYVVLLTVIVAFAGAAAMYGFERHHPGFENYGMALWWTSMRIITAGSDFWPATTEGRIFAFMLSLYGYAIFGYVTATLATFFIGRDAEEENAPVAGSKEIEDLKKEIEKLSTLLQQRP